MFSEHERAYLTAQPLLRLATVASDGQPTVDAVIFEFDGQQFYISGLDLPATRKYRNVARGNRQVALIIDDLKTRQPWQPRGIKVHGTAEIVERDGRFGRKEYLAITPVVSWSWGITGTDYEQGAFKPHKIVWTEA
jgi:pyridoxamine 5'-phosphate oxidase family protein